jgi:outer membrane murein-binding lipoprotein Lpp
MKKLLIAAIFIAVVLAVSCQAPQDIKSQLDKQSAQIMTLEKTIQDQAAKLEQLKMDYEKHMTELHKKPAGTTTSQPQTPTRVGR